MFFVREWHYYLILARFIIKKNHKSLKHLLDQKITTPSSICGYQSLWVTTTRFPIERVPKMLQMMPYHESKALNF